VGGRAFLLNTKKKHGCQPTHPPKNNLATTPRHLNVHGRDHARLLQFHFDRGPPKTLPNRPTTPRRISLPGLADFAVLGHGHQNLILTAALKQRTEYIRQNYRNTVSILQPQLLPRPCTRSEKENPPKK
jgi:hypothetical protein